MKTGVIYVYAECTNLAGSRCFRDADDRDDVVQFDVTVSQYKHLRRLARNRALGCGTQMFYRRCARRVMESLRHA